jgi:putative membrane protein
LILEFAERGLPAVNACLNSLSALLALSGWLCIRRKRVDLHWRLMVAAACASALFLICYVVRMLLTGAHSFEGPAGIRQIYLAILFSHMTLAVAVVPLVGRVLWLGAKGQLDKHRPLARITLPIWLYVSLTGVLIYVLLYHVSGRWS